MKAESFPIVLEGRTFHCDGEDERRILAGFERLATVQGTVANVGEIREALIVAEKHDRNGWCHRRFKSQLAEFDKQKPKR